ncbi:MAG: PQQ-like beta-propeller repeat protein [Planctomycetes bacterium]|nr:PQQ-like beta-propeller repeat protein [Planctomycetota bacterium]
MAGGEGRRRVFPALAALILASGALSIPPPAFGQTPPPATPPKSAEPPPAYDQDLPSLWGTNLNLAGLPSAPVRGGDAIFVNAGGIVCLEAETGKLRWRVEGETTDAVPEPPVWIDDPTAPLLAVTTGRGQLLILKAADGLMAWKAEETLRTSQAPACAGDTLYAIDLGGGITAIDPKSGEKRWSRPGAEGPVLQPVTFAPDEALGYAVIGTRLYAFDPKTGADVWLVNLGVKPVSRPVFADGAVYLLLADGKLMAFDADPREAKDEGIADEKPDLIDRLWTVTATAPWESFRDPNPRVVPALVGETIVVGAESGRLHAIARSDGHEVWRSLTDYLGGPHTPILWRDHLLLSGTGSVSLVDSRNGRRLARATLPDVPSVQFLAVEGDTLFATERLIDAKAVRLDLGPLGPFLPK